MLDRDISRVYSTSPAKYGPIYHEIVRDTVNTQKTVHISPLSRGVYFVNIFDKAERIMKRPYSTSQCYIDGLVQDCSNSSALALELLQSCTKPWMSCCIVTFLSLNHKNNWGGSTLNTLRPRQNDRHFADDILKLLFFYLKIVTLLFKLHWNLFIRV